MATTDSNGIVRVEAGDDVSPLHPVLNSIAQSVSDAFNAETRIWPVANVTARANKVAAIGTANITATKPLFVWRGNATQGRNLEYTVDGSTWNYYPSSTDDTGWVDCTINGSGWTNVASEPVQVRRVGKTVYMRGSIHNSTFAPNTIAAVGTVPTGFRPARRAAFNVSLNTSANLFMRVETNGTINVGWFPSTTATATGSWYGFNNAVYLID